MIFTYVLTSNMAWFFFAVYYGLSRKYITGSRSCDINIERSTWLDRRTTIFEKLISPDLIDIFKRSVFVDRT